MTAELCGEDKEALTTECIQQIQIPCKCKYNKYKYQCKCKKNKLEIKIQSSIFTFANAIWMYRYCRKYKIKHVNTSLKTITGVTSINLPKRIEHNKK